ncbi:MAG: hypothetical protein EBR30_03640 [Cytophagia bacterium]|nr:hypothetical protein [Cytophagia bacterium]NBW34106.1 hypothetical protein [Cytophagia bacterium]
MIRFFLNLFSRAPLYSFAALEQKRHSILKTFYQMSTELSTLHDEQVTASLAMAVKIQELENEKRSIDQAAQATEHTLLKISSIIGEQ